MQKLLNLAKKIAPTIKASTSATGVYYYIKNDKFLKPIEKALNAKEIVYLTFLIQGYKEGRDLQDILQRCERDLFSFSTIEVDPHHPDESCDDCDGDGTINCHECDGEKRVECDDCNGNGEDSEGDRCNTCDGDGYIECPVCDGDGYETCGNCYGSGDQEGWSEYSIEQKNHVSINKSLLNYLEMLDELEPIDESKYGPYVIMIHASTGNTSEREFEDVMGETVFAEVNTNINLEKKYINSGNVNDNELKDWV
jgi:hypothetical protein